MFQIPVYVHVFLLDGGISNGGFIGDGGYSVINERANADRVCKREPRDFDKGIFLTNLKFASSESFFSANIKVLGPSFA